MNNFQTILITIFIAGAVLAVLIFSGVINIGGNKSSSVSGNVVIWGTFNSDELSSVFQKVKENTKDAITVDYVQKDKDTYQTDLIEAFAKDKAPDLFIISPDMIIKNASFIYKIPYESLSEKSFKDTYIDGADIYLSSSGIIGLPIIVDPMIMYYNKNMFSNEGLVSVPVYWEDLFTISDKLTKKENNGNIKESMIALGEFDNINNAKNILATLLLQTGNDIIKRTESGYTSILLDNTLSLSDRPIDSVMSFFTDNGKFSHKINFSL